MVRALLRRTRIRYLSLIHSFEFDETLLIQFLAIASSNKFNWLSANGDKYFHANRRFIDIKLKLHSPTVCDLFSSSFHFAHHKIRLESMRLELIIIIATFFCLIPRLRHIFVIRRLNDINCLEYLSSRIIFMRSPFIETFTYFIIYSLLSFFPTFLSVCSGRSFSPSLFHLLTLSISHDY